MKILVTGAAGLVGCHATAALLDAGHEVAALVRDPAKLDAALSPFGRSSRDVEIVRADIEDADAVRRAVKGRAGVLHGAGRYSRIPAEADLIRRINVEGTRTVLEAAAAAGVARIVHVSSMLALFPPKGAVMTPDDPVVTPRSTYAITKAESERIAREIQARAPVTIVYPTAIQGPDDPTFSSGPQNVANALRDRRTLVTEGGFPYTDARDLAAFLVAVFAGRLAQPRAMAPSFHLSHADYRELLERVTGHPIRAIRLPGWAMRLMGRAGDVVQMLGRDVPLTFEAAEVFTRSVPVDDRAARAVLGRAPIPAEESFRDLIRWMARAGHVTKADAGLALVEDGGARAADGRAAAVADPAR